MGDPEQEFFVDGMTDALITNLAKVGGMKVISRTSVMQYKGTRKPLALWDRRSGQLHLATDSLGTRNLHTFQGDRFLAFSSEAKGLLDLPSIRVRPDLRSVCDLLAFGYALGDRCLFGDVELLDLGAHWIADGTRVSKNRHFTFPEFISHDASPDEGVEILRSAVRERSDMRDPPG